MQNKENKHAHASSLTLAITYRRYNTLGVAHFKRIIAWRIYNIDRQHRHYLPKINNKIVYFSVAIITRSHQKKATNTNQHNKVAQTRLDCMQRRAKRASETYQFLCHSMCPSSLL